MINHELKIFENKWEVYFLAIQYFIVFLRIPKAQPRRRIEIHLFTAKRLQTCYAPVKLFCPNPPLGTPEDTTFWGVAPVFLSLYFYLAPPYIITKVTLFSSAPPFFITRIYSLTPGLPGGDGGRTIRPAHKYIVCKDNYRDQKRIIAAM